MGSKKTTKNAHKTHRKKGKGSAVLVAITLCLVCLSVVCALSFTVLFKANTISVQGESIYTDDEIIAASGMAVGKNMLVSIFDGTENRIEKNLPYIANAKIERSIDGNVVIKVTAGSVDKSFAMDDKYIYVDADNKVLEISDAPAADKPVVKGVALSYKQVGEKMSYIDDTAKQLVYDVFSAAQANGLNVSSISTDEKFSYVDVMIGDKYLVHLLNTEKIDYKLLHIKKSMDSMNSDKTGEFTFSETNEERVVFTPKEFGNPEQNDGENSIE